MGIIIFFAVIFIIILAFSNAPENKATPAQTAAQITVSIFFGIPLLLAALVFILYSLSEIDWSVIGIIIEWLFYITMGSILVYTGYNFFCSQQKKINNELSEKEKDIQLSIQKEEEDEEIAIRNKIEEIRKKTKDM